MTGAMISPIPVLISWMVIGTYGATQAGTCNTNLLPMVEDKHLTASSQYVQDYGPTHARLSSTPAWCPATDDSNPWIQVDFREQVMVVAIVSKGSNDVLYQEWVQSYLIQYKSGGMWVTVTHGSNDEFPANFDRTTLVKNDLPSAITCQILRLYPKDCHLFCSIRFDVIGCQVQKTTTTTTTTTTATSTTSATTALTTTEMTTSPLTTSEHGVSSFCKCSCTLNSSSLTALDLKVKISHIVQNLTVSKKKTSGFMRSISCAQDSRPEVVYVGYVGIAMLVFVCSSIVLPDLLTFSNFLYTVWKN